MNENKLSSDVDDDVDEFCANWISDSEDIFDKIEENEEFRRENMSSTLNCDMPTDEHQDILATNFGHTQFRPLQWKIISSIITERRDVCAVIATGYGKSLCYQYPPVYKNGTALVISPLISLMEDQVLSLKMSNIPACFLGSAQSKKKTTMKEILEGMYKVVYATPEYVTGEYGMKELREISESVDITLLAIDEAHCVSQWGHDFRPQYRNLWKVRKVLPNVPVLAVTATATSLVQEDIIKSLQLRNPLAVSSSFDRPNLFFEAMLKSGETYTDIQKCMNRTNANGNKFTGSTIIYCLTQKSTEAIHKNLSGHGIKCVMYHAGLNINERRKAHEEFVKDKVKCIVATIAFGMGIDKPDVRNVIHYGASKDLEGYYQEVGRAGRDGLPARCIVFFNSADFTVHQNLRERVKSQSYRHHLEESSNIMEKFLNTTECRRKFILRYFNDNICRWENLKPRRNCCDNCLKVLDAPAVSLQYEGMDKNGMYNLKEDAKLFLQAVYDLNGTFGIGKYCLLLKGSKRSELPSRFKSLSSFGKGSHKSLEWWKIVGRILNSEGYLIKKGSKDNKFLTTISLTPKGTMFLHDRNPNLELKINPPLDMKQLMKGKIISAVSSSNVQTTSNIQSSWISDGASASQTHATQKNSEKPDEKAYRMELYKILLNTRNDLAYTANCSPYMVASNTALMQMSKNRPKTIQEFKLCNLDGMTEGKTIKFGQNFVNTITKFCSNKSCSYEISSASNSTEVPNAAQKKTVISNLQQFAFIENKIKVTEKSNILFCEGNDDDFTEISDASLNNIYDNLNDHLDETFTEINEDKIEKINNSLDDDALNNLSDSKINGLEPVKQTKNLDSKSFQIKEPVDDETADLLEDDWLNSPKSDTNADHMNENSEDFQINKNTVDEFINANEKIETHEQKRGIKNKRSTEEWCGENKRHFSNRFLEF